MHNKPVAAAAGQGFLRPAWLLTAIFAIIALAGSMAFASPARAEIQPDIQPALVPSAQQIADAKTHVANVYDAHLRGEASLEELNRVEADLSRMTGEDIRTSPGNRRFDLSRRWDQFRQTTSYYCGPATVQSILWYLKGGEPAPEGARLSGDAAADQQALATDAWLQTESFEGTNWGDTVPGVINRWRGTNWYAAFGTPNVGGTMDKDQAMRYVQYAIDHDRPVAANVIYSPGTFTPAGFSQGYTYMHWETIIGYFDRDGQRYIRLGESYGGADLPYVPVQEIPWDQFWPAIGEWYGIVW